jgi:hypothetical protein
VVVAGTTNSGEGTHACGGGARLRFLYYYWLGGEANEMEQGEADAALRV